MKATSRSVLMLICIFVLTACAPFWKDVVTSKPKYNHKKQLTTTVKKMGYTVQVGAFTKVDNAIRLNNKLEKQNISSFYFRHTSGLYKVRFGNYPTIAKAQEEIDKLKRQGIINEVYIVKPGEYTISKNIMITESGKNLRKELVKTARSYIGLPYQWGSCTINGPVDCSGLVMAVYELNGLSVPRTSEEQYKSGIPIQKSDLEMGDLIFFATNGDGRISHVGIYIGDDIFIHAPGKGKTICEDSLSKSFFEERYFGSCTYLQ